MYTHTCVFSVFKKVDKLMNITRMNTKPGKLTAADKNGETDCFGWPDSPPLF